VFEVRVSISHLYSQPEARKPALVTEMKASVSGLVPAISFFPLLYATSSVEASSFTEIW
jgi:hypothetical protein